MGATRWDGKIVGKDFRLQWSDATWSLEELPQKGKKKLKIADLQNPYYLGHADAFIPANILRVAKVSPSDSFDHVKDKIKDAMLAAAEDAISKAPPDKQKHLDYLRRQEWYEKEVYFTQVMPEGMEAFTAEGKDFTVKVEWTDFKAYSPNSDFQQSDPHYTLYQASAPTAARKLYQLLKEDPNALKSIGWDKFDDWLKTNKIGYKIHFSQWS